MPGSSRRFALATGAVGTIAVLVGLGALAQVTGDDPRNTSQEYYDAVNGAACLEHHSEDGFVPFGFRFKQAYDQLPLDDEVLIEVDIWQATNFRNSGRYAPHMIRDITLTLDKTEAPNVDILTEDFPDPVREQWEPPPLDHGETFAPPPVEVGVGAHQGGFVARVVAIDPPIHEAGVHGDLVLTAGGHQQRFENVPEAELALTEEYFRARGPGNYTFNARWQAPQGMPGAEVTLEVELWIDFQQETTHFVFHPPKPALFTRDPPDRTTIQVPVRINSAEHAHLDFEIRAEAYHQHDADDKAPLDTGTYHRFLTMDFTGGDELVVARQAAPTPVGEVVNLYNMLTRLFGFIALLLVISAMFTGGVFGKSSRRFMNRIAGGAKKRVLWHSAAGFLIVVVATLHFALALVETRHDISRGLLWGGIAWALLISLGFTGYYQVRIVKKWSYRTWRHVHLWSAVAVLLFVLVHAVLEGSDLDFVHDVLPDWSKRLVWP